LLAMMMNNGDADGGCSFAAHASRFGFLMVLYTIECTGKPCLVKMAGCKKRLLQRTRQYH
jgi:hypothetical protein